MREKDSGKIDLFNYSDPFSEIEEGKEKIIYLVAFYKFCLNTLVRRKVNQKPEFFLEKQNNSLPPFNYEEKVFSSLLFSSIK